MHTAGTCIQLRRSEKKNEVTLESGPRDRAAQPGPDLEEEYAQRRRHAGVINLLLYDSKQVALLL